MNRIILALALPFFVFSAFGQSVSNNTSACSANGVPTAGCNGVGIMPFLGNTVTDVGLQTTVLNPLPTNVSTLSIKNYLYPGATTRMMVEFQPWFCNTNSPSNCNGHKSIGMDESNAAQVLKQAQWMKTIGADLLDVDYYGCASSCSTPQSSAKDFNLLGTTVLANAIAANPSTTPKFSLVIDAGALSGSGTGQCPNVSTPSEACLENAIDLQIDYMEQTWLEQSYYEKRASNGHPIVMFFLNQGPSGSWSGTNFNTVFTAVAAHATAGQSCGSGCTYASTVDLVDINSGSFSEAGIVGGYAWPQPNPYTSTDQFCYLGHPCSFNYLADFYATARANPSQIAMGVMYKGFNDTNAGWGVSPFRVIAQECGQTLALTAAAAGTAGYKSSSQLEYMQIATWNDYEESTAVEMGVDNCFTVNTPSISSGNINWTLSKSDATYASTSTISSFSIYTGTTSPTTLYASGISPTATSYAAPTLTAGQHAWVYMVGQPLIQNRLSPPTQTWAGVLSPTYGAGACTLAPSSAPASCAIDWTTAGVQGGIPTRSTQSGSTITCPGGTTDQTSIIQTALNAATSGKYVYFTNGAGACYISTAINIPSNVSLRGSGADSATLNCHGSNSCVTMGSTPSFGSLVTISSGATAGSTSMVVSSAAGMTTSGYLIVTEKNNLTWVDNRGGEGNCTWCDGGLSGTGLYSRQQVVKITGVAGTTITFTPALYADYTNVPSVSYYTMSESLAGAENFQIFGNNTSGGSNTGMLSMFGCVNCWAKGIEVNYADGDFLQIQHGLWDEVRDSYFSNAYLHSPGGTDSSVELWYTSASKVENNIIERAHIGIILSRAPSGNVIGYNFIHGTFASDAPNFQTGGLSNHGAHPMFILYEGNVALHFIPDQIWGSSSHGTAFRNWFTGAGLVCNPTSGRGTVNCTPIGKNGAGGVNGWLPYQYVSAVILDHLSTYYNLVGNVLGSAEENTICFQVVTPCTPPNPNTQTAAYNGTNNRNYDSVTYEYNFGYGEANDNGSGTGCSGSTNPPCHSTTAQSTAFLHGNYTNASGGAITWSGSVTHTLPASFYLSAKPSWWGSIAYPSVGPDVTGGTGAGGHASLTASNPAQNCYYNVMGGTEGGAGTPRSFNAATCYAAAPGPVATPTFSPIAGTYIGTQSITISSITAGATICYTTNGSTPTADGAGTCTVGTTYSVPVSVPISETLKAIGSLSGNTDSAVNSAAYVINIVTPTAPSGLFAKLN